MGKGKGKGGCGLLEGIGDCIQCLAGTICCLCVSGPVLIIVGIVFIVSAFDDTRGERIDEFKVAVDAWNGGAVDYFSMTSNNSDWTYSLSDTCGGGLDGVQMPQSQAQETLFNEAKELNTFGSYPRVSYYQDAPAAVQASIGCTFNFGVFSQSDMVGNVSVPAATREMRVFSEMCSESRAAANETARITAQRRQQDFQKCVSSCQSQGGQPSGSTITSFRCERTMVPAEICMRVTFRDGQWTAAQGTLPDRPGGASGPGCFMDSPGNPTWSDTRLKYASVGRWSVPVRVRHERDPYLYFLDISDGTGDFGLKTGEKLTIGFTLLAIGTFITLLVCGCCCLIVKFARSFAKGKQEKPSNPVGAALYGVSAKYGNYIPGGKSHAHPTGGTTTGVPAAHVNKPPGGYGANAGREHGAGTPDCEGEGSPPISAVPGGHPGSTFNKPPGHYGGNTGYQSGPGAPYGQGQGSQPYGTMPYAAPGGHPPSTSNQPPSHYGGSPGYQSGPGAPYGQGQGSQPYGTMPYAAPGGHPPSTSNQPPSHYGGSPGYQSGPGAPYDQSRGSIPYGAAPGGHPPSTFNQPPGHYDGNAGYQSGPGAPYDQGQGGMPNGAVLGVDPSSMFNQPPGNYDGNGDNQSGPPHDQGQGGMPYGAVPGIDLSSMFNQPPGTYDGNGENQSGPGAPYDQGQGGMPYGNAPGDDSSSTPYENVPRYSNNSAGEPLPEQDAAV